MRAWRAEFGQGTALGEEQNGFIRTFFGSDGCLVPTGPLQLKFTQVEQILAKVQGGLRVVQGTARQRADLAKHQPRYTFLSLSSRAFVSE
jgi:hypothetical protein